jgi:hypothetical protein
MTTFIVISYIIITIITGILGFLHYMNNNEPFGCSLVCSIIGALLIPPLGLILLIVYLLPIIIPCATAIYIWG